MNYTVKTHLFSLLDMDTEGAFFPNSASISSVFLYIFLKLTDTDQQSSTSGSHGGQCSSVANSETRPQDKKKKF